jgi:hypothetical protein
MINECGAADEMRSGRGNLNAVRNHPPPSAPLSTTNPIGSYLGYEPGLRDVKTITNCLRYGKVQHIAVPSLVKW